MKSLDFEKSLVYIAAVEHLYTCCIFHYCL